MKILIITAFFPPQNSIASLRPYSWAKYWALAGHEVTVLTTPKKELPSDSPMVNSGFTLLEVPIPGLHLISRLLGRGPSQRGAQQKNGVVRDRSNFASASVLGQWLGSLQRKYGVAYGARMPDPMDLWCGSAFKAVKGQSWDLVVSTAGPYSVHAPAYKLHKLGIAKKWIADWRDLWVDNHMFPGLPGFRLVERYLEKRWCSSADAITTVSQPLADVMSAKYGNKVHVIFNGFDAGDIDLLPVESAFPDDGVLRIVYTGSIYAGKQDPSPLFKAIAQLAAESILTTNDMQVLFCGNNANVNEIAQAEGVAEYVKYLGFLPRNQALQLQRDASVLLFLAFESESAQGILTGKLFEYIHSGTLVWAIGNSQDESVAKILGEADCGIVMGKDTVQIKSAILQLVSSRTKRTSSSDRYAKTAALFKKYSRSEQATRMLKIVG